MNYNLDEQDLKKLSRKDLLIILIEQNEKIDELSEKLEIAEKKLKDRNIELYKAGSIAEAALRLNGVFEAAEDACEQYIENIKRLSETQKSRCDAMERATRKKCEKILDDANKEAEEYWKRAVTQFEEIINNPDRKPKKDKGWI